MKFRLPLILIALAGCSALTAPPAPQPRAALAAPRAVAATANWPDRRPIGTLALSDALEVAPGNLDGFHPSIVNGPRATLGQNCVWFCEGAADRAKGYPCDTLYVWTSFGGERYADVGYDPDVLDSADGITLADIRACAAAIAARGIRPGIIIRPQSIVRGVNRPRYDGSNPVGTLLWQAACARANGFMDFYVDSNRGETMPVNAAALDADRLGQVANAFPDARFLVEFWDPGYAKYPNVIHWRGSAKTFTNDHAQAVQLDAADVKSKAQQAAWGKRLHDTGSTVLLNCRPDDPTLPQRQAGIVAAWKASRGQ